MKIAVAGTGYVGLSLATLLSQKNEVVAYDINPEKVENINKRISPIHDVYIEEYFKEKELNLKATLDYKEAFKKVKFVIICTPTNFDKKKNYFDTSSVEEVIKKVISMNDKNIVTVIKSTIPVGFTEKMKKKYKTNNIVFSPEFQREGKSLYDSLYPAKIIVGEKSKRAEEFAKLLSTSALKKDIDIFYMNSTEAEALKLFHNAYLALRVNFFNEIDTFAEVNNLNTKDIIDGVCCEPRIGNYYNNPSFGYGGYCLPKDTKQLLVEYKNIPQNMIEAIVKANETREEHIVNMILKKKPKIVGTYRLLMKTESDNFRSSAIQTIMDLLKEKGIEIQVYEPTIKEDNYDDYKVIHDIKEFKKTSDLIIANRYNKELDDVKDKVYTRDIYGEN